jgi:hypothetical protein
MKNVLTNIMKLFFDAYHFDFASKTGLQLLNQNYPDFIKLHHKNSCNGITDEYYSQFINKSYDEFINPYYNNTDQSYLDFLERSYPDFMEKYSANKNNRTIESFDISYAKNIQIRFLRISNQ